MDFGTERLAPNGNATPNDLFGERQPSFLIPTGGNPKVAKEALNDAVVDFTVPYHNPTHRSWNLRQSRVVTE